jgi:hypothetical protein
MAINLSFSPEDFLLFSRIWPEIYEGKRGFGSGKEESNEGEGEKLNKKIF